MARSIVPGFRHHPGLHCGSTAFRDVLMHLGIGWSEPMVFGLGSGPWFVLLRADGFSPSRLFFGRSAVFDASFVANTGLDFAEVSTRDVEAAWRGIRELIDGGEPVLLKSDIRYLPYYRTETEFNGHKIVCAGYDEEAGSVLVADTHFEGIQTIGVDDVKRALASAGAPIYFSDCMYGPIRRSAREQPLAVAISRALRTAADQMLDASNDAAGLPALEAFAAEVEGWKAREDAAWIARFGYQVIERRGTGGGLFRRMYSDFLREASEHVRLPARAVDQMSAIAALWTAIAASMKDASEGREAGWREASERAVDVARREREFFAALDLAFPSRPD